MRALETKGSYHVRPTRVINRPTPKLECLEERLLLATSTGATGEYPSSGGTHTVTIAELGPQVFQIGPSFSDSTTVNLVAQVDGPGAGGPPGSHNPPPPPANVLPVFRVNDPVNPSQALATTPMGSVVSFTVSLTLQNSVAMPTGIHTISYSVARNSSTGFISVDQVGSSNDLTGTLDINNAPLANSSSATVVTNTDLLITLTGSDVNGDALTFRITDLPDPANGSLFQTTANGGAAIPLNGNVIGSQLIFRPVNNVVADDEFQFISLDGRGGASNILGNGSATITVNNNAPAVPGIPQLTADTGTAGDNITNTATFDVTGAEAGANVSLRRSTPATVIGAASGPGTVSINDNTGATGSFTYAAFQTQTGGAQLSSPDSAASPVIVVDQIAPAINPTTGVSFVPADLVFGGSSSFPTTANPSPSFTVAVTEQRYTAGKNNLVSGQILSIATVADPSTNLLLAPLSANATINGSGPLGATTDQTPTITFSSLPIVLAVGEYQATIRVTDAAGNITSVTQNFTVVAPGPSTAAGTPVVSQTWDVSADLGGNLPQPWTMTFDRTTQTVWLSAEKAARVAQFDPGSSSITVYDLATALAPLTNITNPHGIIFDFETQIFPRVWFAQRNQISGLLGRVSYVDLVNDQVVSYDLTQFGVDSAHATFMDKTGTLWVTAEHSKQLLEIRFQPPAGANPTINGDIASVVVHDLAGLGLDHPHGVEVVTDDQTGDQYVWFTEIDRGRVVLLRTNPSSTSQEWFEWQIDPGTEGFDGHAEFVGIDDNETPGDPTDDKIYFSDPGIEKSNRQQAGRIRRIDPGTVLTAGALSSPVRTWVLNNINQRAQGTPPSNALPPGAQHISNLGATQQTFLDREGKLFFIDRLSGIGTFDPAPDNASTPTVAVTRTSSTRPAATLVDPFRSAAGVGKTTVPLAPATPQPTNTDQQPAAGLDQYFVLGPIRFTGFTAQEQNVDKGNSLYRAALAANNVVFGSLARNDLVSTTIFADTARRPLAVVNPSANERFAFQVLRNGNVILTYHGPDELVDTQVNLTADLGGPVIDGDLSAIVDSSGVVHAYGLAPTGNLVEYRYDPAAKAWSTQDLGGPPAGAGVLLSRPSAFVDSVRGAGALVTTDLGHLVVFYSDGTAADLSAGQAAGFAVYSSVGVLADAGKVYIYGTNQTGALLQYSFAEGNPLAVDPFQVINVTQRPAGQVPPQTRIFQDVQAYLVGGSRHVFGVLGSSLVHYDVTNPASAFAENVTSQVQPTAGGYASFQQPFAARVYTNLAVLPNPGGDFYVYGTNGRDLVEFRRVGGAWSANNLTNNTLAGSATESNAIFGAPAGYQTADGDRHILQINADGEVVEYYYWAADNRFHTQNITLAHQGREGGLASLADITFATAAPVLPVGVTPTALNPTESAPESSLSSPSLLLPPPMLPTLTLENGTPPAELWSVSDTESSASFVSNLVLSDPVPSRNRTDLLTQTPLATDEALIVELPNAEEGAGVDPSLLLLDLANLPTDRTESAANPDSVDDAFGSE